MADLRHTCLFGADLGSPRGQELADFRTVVHDNDATTKPHHLGCPVSTPIKRNFLTVPAAVFLEHVNPTRRTSRSRVAAVLVAARWSGCWPVARSAAPQP